MLPRCLLIALLVPPALLWGAVSGRITGTVKDQSDAVIPSAAVTVTNTAQGIQTRTTTDTKGVYTFPSLPVGHYDLKVESPGFRPASRTNLVLDIDSALQVDVSLEVAE